MIHETPIQEQGECTITRRNIPTGVFTNIKRNA